MFFHFHQNNSGGEFEINDTLTHHMIIEASSYTEANAVAEGLGIYFDGVDAGRDCKCCGDRWERQTIEDFGTEEPEIYAKPAESLFDTFFTKGEVYCRVFYKDGMIKELKTKRKPRQGKEVIV